MWPFGRLRSKRAYLDRNARGYDDPIVVRGRGDLLWSKLNRRGGEAAAPCLTIRPPSARSALWWVDAVGGVRPPIVRR